MARSDIFQDVVGDILPISVSLDRYQELMRLPIAAFNGLLRPADGSYDCPTIWQQTDLDQLYENLRLAQEQREVEVGFYLAPTYIIEEYPYSNPIILKKKHLQLIGLETVTDIELGVDFSAQLLANDNITITVTVDFTDASQIHVFYPDEDVEITPKSKSISGIIATIVIPKARLVDPIYNINYNPSDSDELRLYEDTQWYLTTVDVKRIHYAENGGIDLVWDPDPCLNESSETVQTAKGLIDNYRLGIVNAFPAVFTSETAWTYGRFTKFRIPDRIRIRYVSGMVDARGQMLTARLSHAQPNNLSPCEICWRDDVVPHPSKLNTPYGITKAAVDAWIADSRYRIGHGGMVKA